MPVELAARAPLTPVTHRVVGRRDETADVVTLLLEATDGSRLRYAAGQFNMLYAYAVGEVAISISANPVGDGPIAHTVRNVGTVSRALCELHPGDSLGLRGPLAPIGASTSRRGPGPRHRGRGYRPGAAPIGHHPGDLPARAFR